MIKFDAISRPAGAGPLLCTSGRLVNTTRTSWMANNAIPDSITMNMICRSVVSLEFNVPNVCSIKVGLTFKNTLRIFNTINPVTRAFTAMDAAKPVRITGNPQGALVIPPCSNVAAPFDASQVARGYEFKSAYQMKIHLPTYVCDCQN